MTGPEKETLAVLLRVVESFRVEVREDIAGVRSSIGNLDQRVQKMERADARAAGVAQGTASAVDAGAKAARSLADKAAARSISVRGWIAIGIAAATGVAGLLIRAVELLNGH